LQRAQVHRLFKFAPFTFAPVHIRIHHRFKLMQRYFIIDVIVFSEHKLDRSLIAGTPPRRHGGGSFLGGSISRGGRKRTSRNTRHYILAKVSTWCFVGSSSCRFLRSNHAQTSLSGGGGVCSIKMCHDSFICVHPEFIVDSADMDVEWERYAYNYVT